MIATSGNPDSDVKVRIMKIGNVTDIEKKKVYTAYKEVFDRESPQVVEVLRDLCEAHGVFNGGFNTDPYLNAFGSGERNVVLRILTILQMKSEDIISLTDKGGF